MRRLSKRAGAGVRSRGCLLHRLTRQPDPLVATLFRLCLSLPSSKVVSRLWTRTWILKKPMAHRSYHPRLSTLRELVT